MTRAYRNGPALTMILLALSGALGGCVGGSEGGDGADQILGGAGDDFIRGGRDDDAWTLLRKAA
jgi:hypothetical protein